MSRFLLAMLATIAVGSQAWTQPPPAPMPPPVVDVPRPAPLPSINTDAFPPLPKMEAPPVKDVTPMPKKNGSPALKSNVGPAPIVPNEPTPIPVTIEPKANQAPSTANAVDPDYDSCGCGGCCNATHCTPTCRPGIQRPLFDFSRWSAPTLFPATYDTCKSCSSCENGVCGPHGRVWLEFDVLNWQVQGNLLPALVTTSPTTPLTPVAQAGVLPNATVIFGNQIFNGDPRWGARLNTGLWLNRSQTFGFQVGGFMVEDQSAFQGFTSSGTPILARPFLDVPNNTQKSQLVAYPNVVSGTIGISEHNSFSGLDFAFRGNVCCGDTWRIDALLGFRHLRFAEQLAIQERLVAGPNAPVAIGIPVGTIVNSFDRFDTGNYFYGLQVGTSGEVRLGERISLSGTGKVSFGAVDQGVGIDGATRFTPPDTVDRVGGLLALSSNIGSYKRSDVSLVPELMLNLGYQWNQNTRLRIGYDLIYLPNVQRPGQVIDLGIDPQRIPPQGRPTVARPFFPDSGTASDLLVQGFHVGLEFRY